MTGAEQLSAARRVLRGELNLLQERAAARSPGLTWAKVIDQANERLLAESIGSVRLTKQTVSGWTNEGSVPRDFISLWALVRALLEHTGQGPLKSYYKLWKEYWELARNSRRFETGPAPQGVPVDIGDATAVATGNAEPGQEDECPYRGLEAFGPEDAQYFFGREHLVGVLLDRVSAQLDRTEPLLVTGPSGAGKSSLLRAGLVPAAAADPSLADGQVILTPGEHPVQLLADQFCADADPSRVGQRLFEDPSSLLGLLRQAECRLLIVDQFEELFNAGTDERERRVFIEALNAACGRGSSTVVIGLRADFFGHCAAYAELEAALAQPLVVGPMTPSQLREAIVEPARTAGLTVEEGLVNRLLEDLGAASVEDGDLAGYSSDPSGILPLLSHTLLVAWQYREDRRLTLAGYQRTGGINHSLARTADTTMKNLDLSGRDLARRMLTRLVHLGEGTAPTRRQVPLADMLPLEGTAEHDNARHVLDQFVRARLITADRNAGRDNNYDTSSDTAEITHEALIRAWKPLRDWLEEDRASLLVRQKLAADAREWSHHDHDPAFLYRRTRLQNALDADQDDPRQGTEIQAFLDAGIRQDQAERSADRRRVRDRRLVSSVLAILLVIAAGAAVVAIDQNRTLNNQSRVLDKRLEEAIGSRLAGEAIALSGIDPLAAKRLAIAAAGLAPKAFETRNALVTLYHQPELYTYLPADMAGDWQWTQDKTGHVAAAATSLGHEVKIFDVDARRLKRTITLGAAPLPDSVVGIVSLSRDGKVLAVARKDNTVNLLDTNTGRSWPRSLHTRSSHVELNATGTRLLTAEYNPDRVKVWDTTTGRLILDLPQQLINYPAIFTSDGTQLVRAKGATLEWWNLDTGRKARKPTLALERPDSIRDLAISRDGRMVAIRPQGDFVAIVRLDDLDKSGHVGDRTTGTTSGVHWFEAPENGLAFSADQRYLLAGKEIWDVEKSYLGKVWHTDRPCFHFTFGPQDQTVRCVNGGRVGPTVFSFAGVHAAVRLTTEYAGKPVFSADGSTLAVLDYPDNKRIQDKNGQPEQRVEIWDPILAKRKSTLPIRESSDEVLRQGFELSSDGRLLACWHKNGDIDIWDTVSVAKKATLHTRRTLSTITPIAFSPDSRTLGIASMIGDTSRLDLWDVPSASLRSTSTGQRQPVGDAVVTSMLDNGSQVLFSHDGRIVISAPDQGVVEVATGKRLVSPQPDLWRPLALSRNGVLADQVTNDKTLNLWDAHTLRLRIRTQIAVEFPRWMRFSPDGDVLAIAGEDSDQIRLWNVRAKRPDGPVLTGSLTSHTTAFAFTPGGSKVIALDDAGRLRSYLIDPVEIKAELCTRYGPLSRKEWETLIGKAAPYRNTC